jgi:hypothetical protein
VVGCGRGVLEVGENGAALQAAGLAGGADPFDPAVAVLRLGTELDLSEQHAVAERPLGDVVRGVYPSTSQNVHRASYSSSSPAQNRRVSRWRPRTPVLSSAWISSRSGCS